jgi:hypothetical protein
MDFGTFFVDKPQRLDVARCLLSSLLSHHHSKRSHAPTVQQRQPVTPKGNNNKAITMAAVLCTALGDLCSTTCNALSQVVCLPCRALNLGCESLGQLLCTPFMPYIVVTFALNTPAVVYGIMGLINNFGCASLVRWLAINALLSGIHMIACLYIVQKIRESFPEEYGVVVAVATPVVPTKDGGKDYHDNAPAKVEEGYVLSNFSPIPPERGSGKRSSTTTYAAASATKATGGANSLQRIKHVLCYDVGMAVYIIVCIVWMVWLSMGIGQRFMYQDDASGECDGLPGHMNVVILCGYVWMTVVAFTFCCSILCVR